MSVGISRGATGEPSSASPAESGWQIRAATRDDLGAVAAAVAELLGELGATPPPQGAMRDAAQALVQDPSAGALLLAESDGLLVGLLGASWQTAIHVAGRYGLIQDLWVREAWRSRAIGAGLLGALLELAGELGIARVEVGLPRESFAALDATEAFYRANGFTPLGARMRRVLG